MKENKFPGDKLENGMFGAVETTDKNLRWFILIKQAENKFFMVFQDSGYDFLGDDETSDFLTDDGCSYSGDKIIYIVSCKVVRCFGSAWFCYKNNVHYEKFEWRRYGE